MIEILEACKSGDQVKLQLAVDNLKALQLQGVLRKEMLRAQRLLDRHSNILKNLHGVMDLSYNTVAEIKSFSNPPVDVKRTMMATFLLLGHFEEETEVNTWYKFEALVVIDNVVKFGASFRQSWMSQNWDADSTDDYSQMFLGDCRYLKKCRQAVHRTKMQGSEGIWSHKSKMAGWQQKQKI